MGNRMELGTCRCKKGWYLFICHQGISRSCKCDVWCEINRVRVAKGVSPSWEGAALKDSPFGVAGIDGVIQMVNKDIIGEGCYSLYGSACSGQKFGGSNILKPTRLM